MSPLHAPRWVSRARGYLRDQIWETEVSALPWYRASVIRSLRVGAVLVRQVLEGRIPLQASAMTFTTLLSMVPLLIVAFSVVRGFGGFSGLESRLEQFILDNFVPGSQDQVREWLYRFLESVRSGAWSGPTVVLLLGGGVGLLGSLEGALNEVWGVRRTRTLLQRFSIYITLIVFGPILVGASLSMTASVETAAFWGWLEGRWPGFALLIGIGFKIAPVLLTGLALTLLYTILPNAKVRLRASLLGGLVAAFLFEVLKSGYAMYLHRATHYSAIYGSLAAIPIFIFWVHLTWIVVLFGAELTFARDAAEDIRDEELALRASVHARIRVAFQLTFEAARSYRDGDPPPSSSDLARRMHIPQRLVTRVAEILIEGGILHRIADGTREGGLVPARAPEQITLLEVFRAVVDRGHPMDAKTPPEPSQDVATGLMREFDASMRAQWGALSVSNHLARNPRPAETTVVPFPRGRRGRTPEEKP